MSNNSKYATCRISKGGVFQLLATQLPEVPMTAIKLNDKNKRVVGFLLDLDDHHSKEANPWFVYLTEKLNEQELRKPPADSIKDKMQILADLSEEISGSVAPMWSTFYLFDDYTKQDQEEKGKEAEILEEVALDIQDAVHKLEAYYGALENKT